jgi:hypothetical protein
VIRAVHPAVDRPESEKQPDVNPQDLDIRVEGNILTIRGERKFENKMNSYGAFSFLDKNTLSSTLIPAILNLC